MDNRLISRVALKSWVPSAYLQLPFSTLPIYSFLTLCLSNEPGRIIPSYHLSNIIFLLGFLYLLFLVIEFLSFCELSSINNDNNNQRQAQVANTIVNQPTPVILRYYIYVYTLLIFVRDEIYKKPDKQINERNITYIYIYIQQSGT